MMHWRRLLELPFLVILMGLASVAMFLPAGYALALRHLPEARAFFYSGLILFIFTAIVALATATYRPRNQLQSHLTAVVGAYVVLPVMLAIPLQQAVPGLAFTDAWFEMVSSFTTTGATVFDRPDAVAPPVHFWRALVGWFGGFFVLLAILAVLAPMGLGGAELMAGQINQHGDGASHFTRGADSAADPSQRVIRYAGLLFPPYAALTVLLWVGLHLAGDPGLVALSHAMGTISTSGISPLSSMQESGSGQSGEALIFVFLGIAVTKRFWPGSLGADRSRAVWQDAELQVATILLAAVVIALVGRAWIVAVDDNVALSVALAWNTLWGVAFTALSFLTTTGFQSASWPAMQSFGVVLLGLAIVGGGAATAAGGIKLLRLYAVLRHGERELERILHPNSIGGHGPVARRLRREGAYLAWIFFMIFGLAIAAIAAALTLTGQSFDAAVVLAIAGITNTGQLAGAIGDVSPAYAILSPAAKAIIGVAMVLGRLEILAIFAFLSPNRLGR